MSRQSGEEKGLRCPRCGSSKSTVYDSRKKQNFSVMRRRECKDCGFRYMTEETLYGYEFVRDDKPVEKQEKQKHGNGRR